MKRVTYAGSEFLTGDEIAAALLRLGAALAETGEAEAVSIPTREEDGSIGSIAVLVGPASQMVAKRVFTPQPELVDDAVVADLDGRAKSRYPVVATDQAPPQQFDWDQGSSG